MSGNSPLAVVGWDNIDDWVLAAVLDRTDAECHPVAWATILALYLPKLVDFLSRFFVIDLHDAAEAAAGTIRETYSSWDPGARRGFVPELHRRCFASMPLWQPATVPDPPPAWFKDRSTYGASNDIENQGYRRLLVNACFWTVGLEDAIRPDAKVDFVGPYNATWRKERGR